MSQVPPDLQEIDSCMTNFDHRIAEWAERRLRTEKVWSRYAGWNFNGRVWFADGHFHCEVWHYCVPREVISAGSLQELMDAVSDRWGWD